MKQYRSILSAMFAFLVLFSSSSFMVGVHLCRGHVQNIALFTKSEGCAMEKKMPPCHKHESKPCCEDETILHQGEDFQTSATDITLSAGPVSDMELGPVLISEVIPSIPVLQTRFYNYDPPLRDTDLTISFLVFLI
ncbi:MAG: hypothetical protein JNM57_01405 [Cyclobacteriaceae bacterium]|nr:hypothetical protein [Cyclobacteriaceae bacterium]